MDKEQKPYFMRKKEWYTELTDDERESCEIEAKFALRAEVERTIPVKAQISYSKYINSPGELIFKSKDGEIVFEQGDFLGKEYYKLYDDPKFI